MDKRLNNNNNNNTHYLCGNKLDRAAVTELRLLESAGHLGAEYLGEDINLRRGTAVLRKRGVFWEMTRC